jgi:hypothetical protein
MQLLSCTSMNVFKLIFYTDEFGFLTVISAYPKAHHTLMSPDVVRCTLCAR